jgi:GNAT superfamily N-acetyltransferase
MQTKTTEVVKIHNRKEFTEKTISLINTEWPKSEHVRESVLAASNDNMPMSIVLVTDDQQVLGHLRIIKTQENMLGVETVVVANECRGTGLGRKLMDEAERIATEYYNSRDHQGERYLYLSTSTAQPFYEKCGYAVTEAPQAFGNVVSNLSTGQLTGLAAMLQKRQQQMQVEQPQSVTRKGEIWMRKRL